MDLFRQPLQKHPHILYCVVLSGVIADPSAPGDNLAQEGGDLFCKKMFSTEQENPQKKPEIFF
ncbi:MAG: hypothetical protein WCX22_10230 [Methanoregula sp.]|jgi:hypothetical protein